MYLINMSKQSTQGLTYLTLMLKIVYSVSFKKPILTGRKAFRYIGFAYRGISIKANYPIG